MGLAHVRRFRRYTYWTRYPAVLLVVIINYSLSAIRVRESSERKVLVWNKKTNYRPAVSRTIIRLATDVPYSSFQAGAESNNDQVSRGKAVEKQEEQCVCGIRIDRVDRACNWDEEKGRGDE